MIYVVEGFGFVSLLQIDLHKNILDLSLRNGWTFIIGLVNINFSLSLFLFL